ncbi:hypothetical protein T440DRAFT_506797 [Plenodomus tracheiphilus IPT5]|uniref:Uncharacterized protein n=1 Tax=Plenodomus tracheiphilus IPT5 TaxID=1408161 RepID=A0A6A7BAP0_9PLEO|nr:hypothetical protein T440DRAFT_506797 [Plenodomus tracheiphilus IPT5]
MTASLGGLSTSIIAVIAAGGIFGLLALIIITAVLLDMPKRLKRRQNKGIMEETGRASPASITDAEKGTIKVSETEVQSTNASTHHSSLRPTRPVSPDCQCEHPVIKVQPPRT